MLSIVKLFSGALLLALLLASGHAGAANMSPVQFHKLPSARLAEATHCKPYLHCYKRCRRCTRICHRCPKK